MKDEEKPRMGVLDGVRVVDLSRHRAGAVAALLLAELGASVIKVNLTNDVGPGLNAVEAAIWGRSKSVEEIDLAMPRGRERLRFLAGAADVVLQDRTPAEMKLLGTDRASLGATLDSLIFATITGWPATHRHADRPVDDLLVLAESGLLDEQQMSVREGPAFVAFPLGSAHASFLAACGIVARLMHRQRFGRGGAVATSLLQGALLPMMMYWQRAKRPTPMVAKGMPKDTPQPLYRCSDGGWIHVMGDPSKATAVAELIALMSPEQRHIANETFYRGRSIAYPNLGVFTEVFSQRSRSYWLNELWQAGVAVQPATDTASLFVDEQARACDYVTEVATQAFGTTRQPGVPIGITPPVRVGLAASAQEWSSAALSPALLFPQSSPPTSRPDALPLTGIKVIDFGAYLAGPLATMLLADLGADVIKVEPLKGEALRPIEWAFNGCQRGKRDLALDLSHDAAAEVIARLVAQADVVHHNQRMPTAKKLGIDYASMQKINPAIVYTHVSAYGPRGERKDWPGYDQLFQAASGWELASSGAGNPPTWLRFGMMDHLAALASLLGTLAALYHRNASGAGQMVNASLLGASLFTLATAMDAEGKLLPGPQVDQRQLGFSPLSRLYACRDGWIAVSYAASAIASANASGTTVARNTESHVVAAILADSQCVDVAALEAVLLKRDVTESLALFERSKVACSPILTDQMQAFFDNPARAQDRLSAAYPHPVYEQLEQIGAFWDFDDLSLTLDRAPPTLGQHTAEVLGEVGYSPSEVAALMAQQVVRGI